MRTHEEYKEYQRDYFKRNRDRLLAERKEKREHNLEFSRRRQRKYQRKHAALNPRKSVVPPPPHWVPAALPSLGTTPPFASRYGIYGLTARSYPPSSWAMVEDAAGAWGIRD